MTKKRSNPAAEGQERVVPTACHVHGEPLLVGECSIVYGLLFVAPEYFDARDKDFPYANRWMPGGCVIWDISPQAAGTLFCPSCRQAEIEWREAHPEIRVPDPTKDRKRKPRA